MLSNIPFNTIEDFAREIRAKSIQMVHDAKASHLAGALSIADILAVLYGEIMKYDANNPQWDGRDRLIYSKGHDCSALYVCLALSGFYPVSKLDEYGQQDSKFISHVSTEIPGIELSTGSLGHGLPVACGMAYAAKLKERANKVFCIVGDGEMEEGSNWEALNFAAQHRLDNLCLIIDYNKMQAMGFVKDIMDLSPLKEKIEAFNWRVMEIDGNDLAQIKYSLGEFRNNNGKPFAIVANTIKGKGVSFMENELKWHYSSPDDEVLERALKEVRK